MTNAQPIDAYRKIQKLALGPSGAEAEALTKAALLLDGARDAMDDYPAYASALRFNQVLWTIIQADVAEEGNRLPDDVKSDLLSLSLFVDKRTVRALAEPKAEHLAALIEIDRNIARGLRAQGKRPGTALVPV